MLFFNIGGNKKGAASKAAPRVSGRLQLFCKFGQDQAGGMFRIVEDFLEGPDHGDTFVDGGSGVQIP